MTLPERCIGGITVMAQLYQSFSTDRIINAEKLLQRLQTLNDDCLSGNLQSEEILRQDVKI